MRTRKGRSIRKTASLSDLTPEQQDALLAYARENGAKWKSKLYADWLRAAARIDGKHSAELQQIRNSFGPEWLLAVPIDTGLGMVRGKASDPEGDDDKFITIHDYDAVKMSEGWHASMGDPLYAISSNGGWRIPKRIVRDAVNNLAADLARVKKLGRNKFQLGKGTYTKAEIDELAIMHDAFAYALEDPESRTRAWWW